MPIKKSLFLSFTLIELIMVIAVIAILAAAIFVAIDPGRRLSEARNARRWTDLQAIMGALKSYQLNHEGDLPAGVDGELRLIGTSSTSCQITCGAEETRINLRVIGQNNDAEEQIPPRGFMYMDSTDLEFVEDNSYDQEVGMRFTDVSIPQGVTIARAFITFAVDELDSEPTTITFYAEAIDNAPEFATNRGNITARAKTTSHVTWNDIPPWTVKHATQKTPDLSSLLQEVIDRPGWQSGNAAAILVDGTGERTAESYDGESGLAPLLTVEYRGVNTTEQCLDLSEVLQVELPSIPMDPRRGGPEQTYYAVRRLPSGSLRVSACAAERHEVIELIQ